MAERFKHVDGLARDEIVAALRERIDLLRDRLEDPASGDRETAFLRGRIAEARDMIDMLDPPKGVDPEEMPSGSVYT